MLTDLSDTGTLGSSDREDRQEIIPHLRRREWRVILAYMVLTLLLWLLLPKPAFWGLDSGIKWVGCKSFAERGSVSYPYRGKEFDPDGQFRPYPFTFSIVKDGELIPSFPPLFMVLGGIFIKVLGNSGAFLLPLLGGWLLILGCRLLWIRHREERDGTLYYLLIGIGSPLLFYTLELWEYTWAAALLTFSVAFTSASRKISPQLRHQEIILGGVLLGVASGFRPEVLVWGAATVFFWGFSGHSWRSLGLYLVGIAGGILPVILINYWQGGSPLPLHVITNYERLSPQSFFAMIWTRAQNFYDLFIEGFPNNYISLLGLVPLLAIVLWEGWRREEGWYIWLVILVGAVWLLYAVSSLGSLDPISHTQFSGGLLWVMPFASLGLIPLRGERRRFWKLMWSGTFLAFILVASFAPRSGGVHWGPRLIVPFIPLMAILATTRAQRWWKRYPSTRVVIILLVGISIVNQAIGYGVQFTQRLNNRNLNRWAIATGSRPTISLLWWLPGDCALASYNQPWYYTKGYKDLQLLLNGLRGQGQGVIVNCIEQPPYIDDETWWRLGAEHYGDDYFLAGGGSLRRTFIRLIGTGSPAP